MFWLMNKLILPKTRHSKFLISFLLFYLSCLPAVKPSPIEWKELKSGHFIVYFTEDEKFAREALEKSEVYYQRIARDLGYARYSEFWTWDKRVKIYIYPDEHSFLAATSQPKWSQGMADYANKKIISYAWSQMFMDALLPHEITHLIFRDYVGFKGEIPLWLDEGVAQWQEEKKRKEIKHIARQLYKKNELISLEDMMTLDIRLVSEGVSTVRALQSDNEKPKFVFVSSEKLVQLYYTQAVSLVVFLIEEYGSSRFINFCRQLRDGKALDDALRFTYPLEIRSLKELEREWKKYLGK